MRTDQLDGETDWKLKVAVPSCQALNRDEVSETCGRVCVCVCDSVEGEGGEGVSDSLHQEWLFLRICLAFKVLFLPRDRRKTSTTSLADSPW